MRTSPSLTTSRTDEPIQTENWKFHQIPDPSPNSLQLNEVWIVIKVVDENDNPPRFGNAGRPMVGAVPAAAQYGHEIFTIQVRTNKQDTLMY